MMSIERASMMSVISLRVLFGILELLLHRRHLPLLVIQILVALTEGVPLFTWTWIGSKGSPSFAQK